MAQNIDFDKYLAAAGFGESVSLGKRSRRVKPKAPNPVAYAESYAFIRNDATRMELEKLRMHVKVAQIKASGEGLEDIKNKVVDTVKSGASKVKKTLIELYEKAIRFFTETVRYFFSNEKKLGKTLASIKTSLKRTAKESKGEKDTTMFEWNAENTEVIGTGTTVYIGDRIKKIESAASATDADPESVRDAADKEIEDLKEKFDSAKEGIKDITNIESSRKKEMTYTAAEKTTRVFLESISKDISTFRSFNDTTMKGINKQIRDAQKELKDLKKDWKEDKEHDEDSTKKYQVQRAAISAKVKLLNAVKGHNDAALGLLIKAAAYGVSERNKVTK